MFSCDRSDLLNKSIVSFFNHVNKYEKNIYIDFHFVDSGTEDRMDYVDKYNIQNIFFMNPNDPEYSYGMFWSYLHGKFVLFLEDDWLFKRNEKKLFYPNYLEESIFILQKTDEVKGIVLKQDREGKIIKRNISTYLGNHILCILVNPPMDYYYTNGPAMYRVDYLMKTGFFKSEFSMAIHFRVLKWYTGFTYKGISCNNINNYSTTCQGVAYHLGENYSTLDVYRRKVCKTSLY